jgi:hypothetical protein
MRKTPVRLAAVLGSLVMVSAVFSAQQGAAGPRPPEAGWAGVEAGTGALETYGTDTPFVPRAFNTVGALFPAEYAGANDVAGDDVECKPDLNLQPLIEARTTMEKRTGEQILAMKRLWKANAVRFQVSQGALVTEAENDGDDPYTRAVLGIVERARTLGMVVLVSIQTQGYGCTLGTPKLPNADTLAAWSQLTPVLSGDRGVIIEMFNEPQTKTACGLPTNWSWPHWKYGCDGDPAGTEGMLWLGKELRELVPANVLLFDGDNNAGKFNNFTPPADMPANSAYAVHPYFYADGEDGNATGEGWDARFGHLQEAGQALVATEWNMSASCKAPELGADLITRYLPEHKIGLFIHSWDAPAGVLVDERYMPQDSVAKCPEFTGATAARDEFWRQAAEEQSTPGYSER